MTYEDMLKLATPRPWGVYVQPVKDKASAKHELCALVDGTPKFRKHVVMLSADGLAPAITGCGERSEVNAALLAHAVNCHEELVAALEAMAHHFGPIEDNEMLNDECRAAFAKARAALKKATEL